MHGLNIKTCSDLQKLSIEKLSYHFGSWGIRLYDICRGHDERLVSGRGRRKSLSVENTFHQDLQTIEECLAKLPLLYDEFLQRLKKTGLTDQVQSLMVKVKFGDFTQTTIACSDKNGIQLAHFKEMLCRAFSRGNKSVRLIGLGVKFSGPKKAPRTAQLKLF